MFEAIDRLDKAVFLFLNGFHNHYCDILMAYISGKIIWVPLYLAIAIYLIKVHKTKSIYILISIGIVIALSDQFASGLMKPLIARPRPCYDSEISSYVHLVLGCGGPYGFISSHAANSFALGTFLFLLLNKRFRNLWLIFIWAGIVSYSRIYLGVHYPLDIIGGAMAGALIAFLVYWAYLKLLPLRLRI